ncbi:MlaD family protein [Rhodococcus artemisiae]|uniref:MlaD family protein n=1 Tax=Rhodococcus artemisiae TaxID=714159 RepID=A0ABU7LDR5_9NOCA|nr:MlaD family protein [Rhodococcus artemisiae]MEE2059444.1 MlaD family protein [Rhodococcus artemisiae]
MRSRLVRIQLVAFVVIALLGVVYVGARYVRLDNLMGFGQYTVNARFPSSGGVFKNAEVTYRGVPVGRVGTLSLTSDGIDVELKLDDGAPKIPASARAVVANRSAIGEQYVDLRPPTDEGPYLVDGSVIESTADDLPVPVEDLLVSTNELTRSIPTDALHTVVTELGDAFDGRGDELQVLVDSLAQLSDSGVEYLPQTVTLIRDSRTVLDTQSEQSSAIMQFSSDLDLITAQLRDSDPDIRRLIETGTSASDELNRLIADSGPGLTANLTNLAALGETLAPQAIALQPLLAFLPAVAASAGTVAPGDGTVRQGIVLETNNPPSCTLGYEGTHEIIEQMRAENPNFDDHAQDFPFNTEASCEAPQGSVTGVRSANRIVFADPATIQPWDFTPKKDPDKLNLNPVATQLAPLLGVTPK